MIKATIANIKLADLQSYDNNDIRAGATMDAFIKNRGTEWGKTLSSIHEMAKVTKNEIVEFAKNFFKNNYVAVYKHKGEEKQIVKVDKPIITAVNTNSNLVSNFTKQIINSSVKPIEPKFLDYKKDLSFGTAGMAEVISIENKENEVFRMGYRFELGSYSNKLLPYAAQYLSFLSTDKYSAEEISKAFYNLACNYSISIGTESSMMAVTGLQQNFDKAVLLLEDIIAKCKPNEQALEDLKSRLLKSRENAKLNKGSIMSGLVSYA